MKLDRRFDALQRTRAPELWSEIGRREPRSPVEIGPSGARRAGIVLVALTVAASGFAFAVRAFRSPAVHVGSTPSESVATSPTASESVSPILPGPLKATVTASIPIGPNGQTPSVVYGEGAMWVAYYDDTSSWTDHLVKVDPETGEIVDDIRVDTSPSWEVGGGGLTVADGSVWITGSIASSACPNGDGPGQAALVRVDVATDRSTGTVCLGGSFGADVAADANGVWVMIFTSGPGRDPMEIVRVDPTSLQILGRIDLAESYGHWIFAVGGSIVAGVNATANSTIGDSVLAIVDPTKGTLRAEVPLQSYVFLSSDGAHLWATTGDGLEQIDPLTGSIVAGPFDVLSTGDFIGVGAGGIWLLGPEEGRSLFRVDPQTGKLDLVDTISSRFEWNDIAFSSDAIWGLGYDGVLRKLELSQA